MKQGVIQKRSIIIITNLFIDFVFINLIFIALYLKIENIKKLISMEYKRNLKNVGLNKNFIKNIN